MGCEGRWGGTSHSDHFMKILILGATGFIGRNMSEHFSKIGHEVVTSGYTRKADYNEDLRQPHALSHMMDGVDVVIQAAATTSGSKDIVNNPSLHVTDNAVMNSYIFRTAVEAKVKHVVFFSCTTMFTTGRITEESPVDIPPKYFGVAHTKLYCEKLCQFYAGLGDTKFTAIRHSNIYGPHDKFDLEHSHVMGATITKVMRDKWPDTHQMTATDALRKNNVVIIWGNGEETRDLLYIDDLIDFVAAVIEKQKEKFSLYNCGSGHAISIKDLVNLVIKISGKKLSTQHDLAAPSIPSSLWLDCTKAKNELDWVPKITLVDGIKKTIAWWQDNCLIANVKEQVVLPSSISIISRLSKWWGRNIAK